MRQLGKEKIFSYFNDEDSRIQRVRDHYHVWRADGHTVRNFSELLSKIAEINYYNPDYIIMLRGQSKDYRHPRGHSILKPSIFRGIAHKHPGQDVLRGRFEELALAERILSECINAYLIVDDAYERIARFRIVRWSILQHYEVTPTPLLDVTTSPRVALSFARPENDGFGVLFALAVPNISSAVTSNADVGIQAIRLASVCPPSAIRPHFQEGYLLGQYPEIESSDQKSLFPYREVDFGHRLIAKFRFRPSEIWDDEVYPRIPDRFLYLDANIDKFRELMEHVKMDLNDAKINGIRRYILGDRAF